MAVSESTIRSVLKKQGLNVHKADVETFARFASTTDYRTYLTLFSAFKAMRRLYGYTEHEGDHEEEPRLNPSNVFNFDTSAGKTFNVDKYVLDVKGAPQRKVRGKGGLRQQYPMIQACTPSGKMLPPMVCIKSKRKSTAMFCFVLPTARQ